MKRKGIYKPTIEDSIEVGGIEILHPGGFLLTKRTAELAQLQRGLKVLDVSSGRGTQSIFYSKEYNVDVVGLDLSNEMINTAIKNADEIGLENQIEFVLGDSQNLPFKNDEFDVVINECAVGIPDDSQKVLDEMIRVLKPGGKILIHESIWKSDISHVEKIELAERYGTTPMEIKEWLEMLEKAGAKKIEYETEPWSQPEMFWKIRQNRDVKNWKQTLTLKEKLITFKRLKAVYGMKGVLTALKNEKIFYKAVNQNKIGYALFKGEKAQ